MNVPDDLRFAKSHEWIRLQGSEGTVGISDHAQHELTDIVHVELPEIGKQVSAGETVCVVESVKAANDIYSPVSGTVTGVNDAVGADPPLVNTDPYGAGWIFRIQPSQPGEIEALLSPDAYRAETAS